MTLTLYSRWASLLVVLVFFSPLILLAIRIMFVSRRDKNQNNWEVTTARLTGKKDTYAETVVRDGFARIPQRNTDFQIEYVVDGKKYIKYVSTAKTGGRNHGKVRIKYLKKRPSIIKVL